MKGLEQLKVARQGTKIVLTLIRAGNSKSITSMTEEQAHELATTLVKERFNLAGQVLLQDPPVRWKNNQPHLVLFTLRKPTLRKPRVKEGYYRPNDEWIKHFPEAMQEEMRKKPKAPW